jgi:phosphosulfolactate synthase
MQKRDTNVKIYAKLTHGVSELLDDLVKSRVDSKKPRQEGLTYVSDRLQSVDNENFELVAPFIDVVKIDGALPLLTSQNSLMKKIKFYHSFNVRTSTGSTVTEFAILQNAFDRFVGEAAKEGFDIIEIGENMIDLNTEQKQKITETVTSAGLDFQWKVGKRDPRHQLSVEETLVKVEEAIKLGSNKVVLEANQGFSVGIYDEKGFVNWSSVGALTNKYPPGNFIFEAPLESQQSALIAEFGERVNLAEIGIDDVVSVESQRRGILSKASFGVSYMRKDPDGGPAAKFVYYIIKTKSPIEQGELIRLTRLPRRTVQSAVDDLKRQGLVIERSSLDDTRKKVYHLVHSDWL